MENGGFGVTGWLARAVDNRLRLAILAVAIVNAWFAVPQILLTIDRFPAVMFDYTMLRADAALANPYTDPLFLWSPLAIPLLRVLLAVGPVLWVVLHVVALAPLGWRLGLLVGMSYPFLFDVSMGNVMTFVAVVGFRAANGSRAAVLAFFVLAFLMPRPLMVPLIVWLLWKEPWTRWPFVALLAVNAGLVLASGLAFEWAANLRGNETIMGHELNLSPSRFLGWAWWPIGIVLAGVALRFGRLGIASLAIQPYLYPQYLLMALLELRKVLVPHGDPGLARRVLPALVVDEHVAEQHLAPRSGG